MLIPLGLAFNFSINESNNPPLAVQDKGTQHKAKEKLNEIHGLKVCLNEIPYTPAILKWLYTRNSDYIKLEFTPFGVNSSHKPTSKCSKLKVK